VYAEISTVWRTVRIFAPLPNHPQARGTVEKLSLRLRVLPFGFFLDGDVGVGVFPEEEKF
jgi:hypothetical protein